MKVQKVSIEVKSMQRRTTSINIHTVRESNMADNTLYLQYSHTQ